MEHNLIDNYKTIKIMTISEFKTALRNNLVKFSFTKKDGTFREAVGTLNMSYIQKTDPQAVPNSLGYSSSPETDMIRYYDIERRNWRSFHEWHFTLMHGTFQNHS